MLKQAKEIIEFLNKYKESSVEDGFKALLLDKKLEEIFGKDRIHQGCWINDIGNMKYL